MLFWRIVLGGGSGWQKVLGEAYKAVQVVVAIQEIHAFRSIPRKGLGVREALLSGPALVQGNDAPVVTDGGPQLSSSCQIAAGVFYLINL